MTDTFKSGQRRICAGCLAHIEPRDRVCVLYDEIHCMTCLTADEDDAADDLSRDGVDQHITRVDAETYDRMTGDDE